MSTNTAAAATTTAAHAPVNTITTTQRYVPGAPPSASLTKTQKKKKKAGAKGDETEATGGEATDAALTTSAPKAGADTDLVTKPEDVAAAAIASEAAAEAVADHPITGLLNGVGTGPKKTSAVVELVNKRYRALTKKIQRIKEYSSKPVETLNEDQKRTLSTLPILEASARELEDVRKAIEVHEAEEAVHETRRLAEIEAVVKQRIAEAVDNARSTTVSHAVQLVQIVRVLSELPASETVSHAQQVLLSKDVAANSFESYVKLFLTGQGDYAALTAALKEHSNPAAPAPAAAAEEEEAKEEEEEEAEAEAEDPAPAPVTGVPSMASSFHFMQDDELQTPFEEGAEWVQHPEGTEQPTIKTEAAEPESLDWAAEDHADLPPIESLHQGVSGDATPVPPVSALPEEATAAEAYTGDAEHYDAHAAVHSHAPAHTGPPTTKKGPEVDADGFVNIPTKSRRGFGDGWRGGRGEHRGEHRGRGGYRGGGRGEWRGGHREGGGGHREGGHREGGHREGGHREGGYREGGHREGGGHRERESGEGGGSGGEHRGRGEWRGRARGEGRGEWRGRGEYRVRGDRGGYRGRPNEAGAPPAPAPA